MEPGDPSAGEVEFAGGSGTKDDPYLVVNAEQLNAVRKNFNVYYKQMADINLAGYSNWEPINYDGQYWLGYGGYDGNDYLISNLTITEIPQGNRVCIGLFGEVAGKTIKNVNLKDVNINIEKGISDSETYIHAIGGVVGEIHNNHGSLENCHVLSGSIQYLSNAGIEDDNDNGIIIGGVIGDGNQIVNCSNTADIFMNGSGGMIGGVAGASFDIEKCINYGDIAIVLSSSSVTCGGIASAAYGERVEYCVNYGDISESATIDDDGFSHNIGGIVGKISETPVRNCVNYGSIDQEIARLSNRTVGVYVGGIVGIGGDLYSEHTEISNCFNLASSISSLVDNEYVTSPVISTKRILGNHHSASDSISWGGCELTNVYSTDTLLNGKSADEELMSSGIQNACNGETLTAEEMNKRIQYILEALGLNQAA